MQSASPTPPPPPSAAPPRPGDGPRPRLLVTAGPTHEPIDAVRFIGNRSSGRLGIALADAAAARGWPTTLLLGPTHLTASDSRVECNRFRTAADLADLLNRHAPAADAVIMAAAVADYRPRNRVDGKLRRGDGPLVLELEPTEDVIGAYAHRRPAHQLLVGFALEPRDQLLDSAAAKLRRKGLDLIVANPLETMEAPTIEAVVLGADGSRARTPGPVSKPDFAEFLLNLIAERLRAGSATRAGRP